jgi:outer membrane receptor for ferrienterochelin and colicins
MSRSPRLSAGRNVRRFLGALLLAMPAAMPLATPLPAFAQDAPPAQPGRVSGTITDDNAVPLAGAQVSLTGTGFGAMSGADGRYLISGVPAGSYALRVQRLGHRARTIAGIVVRAGEETTINVALEDAPAALGGVVVSASRRAEKITDAPATITSVSTEALESTVGNTFASALKEAKGVDFIQVGMTSIAINARGFNSSFNNRMLMVEDGRIAVLPENGLPMGALGPTPKVDLAGLEVLVGPGSALYGADASNGVISTITKDPRQFPGTTIELVGGSRSYVDVQARHAGVRGNLGYKVAGEFQQADDWENILKYSAGGSIVHDTMPGVYERDLKDAVNFQASTMRGTGALVYYRGDHRMEVNGGWARTDGVGQTNVGRNQLRDWDVNVLQARYTMPHWYFNLYRQQSKSGSSFALNRFAAAQLAPANADLSTDSLRKLSDWPSDGRMIAAEIQGNYVLPMLLNTATVFGAQYRNDMVSSDEQWLWDRVTGEDVENPQQGVYAQATTPVSRFLDIVLAGRYDKHDDYDAQWSPKAGIVVKPVPDQAIRVTYNRAFKSPTILQTSFFIPDWTPIISIYGNTGGFVREDSAGNTLATFEAMRPESNKTWEFGYKGVLAERVFLDATYFKSDYENFMSPLTIIGNPFVPGARTYAKPLVNPDDEIPVNAQGRIVNAASATPIVLTYYNLGNAKVSGVDAGITALATDWLEVRGTVSTVKIDDLELPVGGSPEAAALNSPTTKWTAGATAKEIGPLTLGTTWRNVNGYYFRSGTNTGVIPSFGTLDASVSMRLASFPNYLVNLSVSNLFSCTSEDVVYAPTVAPAQPNSSIQSEDQACGFGRRHHEMINMPAIGTMAFLGIRFNTGGGAGR